jgi:hypothetical protein
MPHTLTGRRGRIQSAYAEWLHPSSTHFLNDAVYAAVLEGEDDFDGLQAAVDRGIFDFHADPGQDFVEVVYHSIERAQRSAQAPVWAGPLPEKDRSLFTPTVGV